MLYARIDVGLSRDAKILRAGHLAELLYLRGILLAKELLSDGEITREQLNLAAMGIPGDPRKLATKLVEVGLWEATEAGWRVPLAKWAKWQMTSAEVAQRREQTAERVRRYRERRSNANVTRGAVTHVTDSQSQSQSQSQSNTPYSPPAGGERVRRCAATKNGHPAEPAGFPAWYDAYPRHVGRRKAAAAFLAAVGRGVPAERLTERAAAYAAAVARWPLEDRKFILHPASWLNAGGYDDDPAEWRRVSSDPKSRQSREGGVPDVERTRAMLRAMEPKA